jgi:hypothetical protein
MPAIQLVQVDVSQLEVVVTLKPGGTADPVLPPVDLSKVVDKAPPVLSLVGPAYLEVPEQSSYADLGATAYDHVDGNSILTRTKVQLCMRPAVLGPVGSTASSMVDPKDAFGLACTAAVAFVDTFKPTTNSSRADGGQIYVLTYTAKDSAGNLAVPLRRYVAITPRCNHPERWCADLSVCSLKGLCSAALAKLASSDAGSIGSAGSASRATMPSVAAFVPPVDRTAPRLRMLGNGVAGITATGGSAQ